MSTTAPVAREQAVRPFADLSRADVPFAGGKGANLGELTRAGLPVPDGFVVGAPAYAAFCDESGLRARLRRRSTASTSRTRPRWRPPPRRRRSS